MSLALAAAMTLILAPGCTARPEGSGHNVLLVTYETTRADHLSAYGYERGTSPYLDQLLPLGTRFENASAVSPRTNPSLASLLTGSYPHDHGVRNLLLPLEPEQTTLAEMLREAGYSTGAVQTHPRLVRTSGFEQGFEHYDDALDEHPLAFQAVDAALRWIRREERKGQPWFMWVHLMDPHWTYDPPVPWRTTFGPDDPRPGVLYRALADRKTTIGPVVFENAMEPDEVQAFVDFYDAEILYTDEALGRLVAGLEEAGARERTLLVLSADHGESLGEHGYFFEHGDFGSQPEIHVPLFLMGPGVPAGRSVAASVPNIDIAPTVTDLLGVASAGTFRGRSLRPLLDGRDDDRACFGETGRKYHEQNIRREVDGAVGKWRWLRQGRYKLVYVPRADGSVDYRLFDLAADPGELRDIARERPGIVERMRPELTAWMSEDPGEPQDYHLSPEAEEVLRSLGYVN